MGSIKLYQVQDWVRAYLKSWGYTDERLVSLVYERFSDVDGLQTEDISTLLDNEISELIDFAFVGSVLATEQRLNYFKMMFLMKQAYLRYWLFDEPNETLTLCVKDCLDEKLYQVVPDLLEMDMSPQCIETYRPLHSIKKKLVKGLKKIIHSQK